MNPKTKKLSTGVLALTAVAIWIPQVMTGIVSKSKTPRSEVSFVDPEMPPLDPGAESELMAGHAPAVHATNFDPALAASAVRDSSSSLSTQLERSESELQALRDATQRIDLNQLIQSYREQHSPSPSTSESTVTEQAPILLGNPTTEHPLGTSLLGESPTSSKTVLERFESEHSLKAVIHGEGDSMLLVGPYLARVGDVLPGQIEVAAIEPQQILLRHADEERWLKLPPFETRHVARDLSATLSASGESHSNEIASESDAALDPSVIEAMLPEPIDSVPENDGAGAE